MLIFEFIKRLVLLHKNTYETTQMIKFKTQFVIYISSLLYYPSNISRYAGQVGYVIGNIKNIKDAMVGDTLFHPNQPVEPMPGFKPAKPMVSGFYLGCSHLGSRVKVKEQGSILMQVRSSLIYLTVCRAGKIYCLTAVKCECWSRACKNI